MTTANDTFARYNFNKKMTDVKSVIFNTRICKKL